MILTISEGQGFNPLDIHQGAAFWTWVIFLVSLPFMWKIVFGPIARALVARDKKAEDAIVRAEEAKAGAEKAQRETEAELAKVRAETGKLLERAREQAERQGRELMEQARAEAQRALDKAQTEIQAEKTRALAEIRDEVVNLSIDAAGRILRKDVDDEAHRHYVKDLLTEVSATGSR